MEHKKFGENSCSFDGKDPSIDIPISEFNGVSSLNLSLSGEFGYKEIESRTIRDGDNIKLELRIDSFLLTMAGTKAVR